MLAHGSHEAMLVARSLGIAGATAHDYEFATLQHQLGLRAATRVVFPDAVPPERLARFGVRPPKLVRYPGIEEEYYLADFEPDRAVLDGIDPDKRARGRADAAGCLALPPARQPALRGRARAARPRRVGARGRPAAHGRAARGDPGSGCRRCTSPEHAVDAQSLVALADLVVSAGGTMNREAAALGTPVYTTFAGRLGAVDEALIRDGRLRPLTSPDDLDLRKRDSGAPPRIRRDPRLLLELLLSAQRA